MTGAVRDDNVAVDGDVVEKNKQVSSVLAEGEGVASPAALRHPKYWLKDYGIRETLGQGNFGKVKLGIDKKTGRKVALKV